MELRRGCLFPEVVRSIDGIGGMLSFCLENGVFENNVLYILVAVTFDVLIGTSKHPE